MPQDQTAQQSSQSAQPQAMSDADLGNVTTGAPAAAQADKKDMSKLVNKDDHGWANGQAQGQDHPAQDAPTGNAITQAAQAARNAAQTAGNTRGNGR